VREIDRLTFRYDIKVRKNGLIRDYQVIGKSELNSKLDEIMKDENTILIGWEIATR